VDVAHATDLMHAAGTGITLTLAAIPPEERDPRLSESMREAILSAITVPASRRPQIEDPRLPMRLNGSPCTRSHCGHCSPR